jgi:hypothetical protein
LLTAHLLARKVGLGLRLDGLTAEKALALERPMERVSHLSPYLVVGGVPSRGVTASPHAFSLTAVAPLDVLIEPFPSRTYVVATLISESNGLLFHQPLGR